MSKISKKSITNEQLAAMVQRGFSEMVTKKEFEAATNEISRRFELIEGHLDAIESELLGIKKDTADVKERLDGIELEIFETKRKLSTVVHRQEYQILLRRVGALESRLKALKSR